ncbi:MAG TPA: flagellin [Acetobacteraceae bacterium]|nr:flagellin [Acetobacteraceae bacterium]
MSSVNTNGAAMAAIRSLSNISMDMARTQARVESGLRISKANDDPAVFAIAQNMRADLNAMSAVKDSLAFGKSALAVARDAATKISDELGKLKQTVTQGQQQGLDAAQIDNQITNALANVDAFARSATFNGVNLLVAGVGGVPGVTDTNVDIVRDIQGALTSVTGTNSTSAGLGLTGLSVNSGAWQVAFDNTLAPANGELLTVTVGGVDMTFELSDGSAALTTTPTATTQVFDVQFTGTDSPLQIIGNLIDRMQGAGIDAGLGGNGELIIRGAATAVTTTITGAGAPAQITGAQGAIAVVEGAIDLMGTRLGNLGANLRQVEGLSDFTKQLNDSVKEGLGALVDADLAEESARLTSLQTKQQLAVQSLSIANQQSQSLLSLFR